MMIQKLCFLIAASLLSLFVSVSSYAVITIDNQHQWAINRLAELEGYTDRWTNYVADQLENDPVAGLAAINLAAASINGATFTDISILNGIITITLNATFNMAAIDAHTITLTPVTADTDVDGNDETIVAWTCSTTVVGMYRWGKLVDVLTYLDWPLSLCT